MLSKQEHWNEEGAIRNRSEVGSGWKVVTTHSGFLYCDYC